MACCWCEKRSCCIINFTKRICDTRFQHNVQYIKPLLESIETWTTTPAIQSIHSLPYIVITSHNRNTACTPSQCTTSVRIESHQYWTLMTTTSDRSACDGSTMIIAAESCLYYDFGCWILRVSLPGASQILAMQRSHQRDGLRRCVGSCQMFIRWVQSGPLPSSQVSWKKCLQSRSPFLRLAIVGFVHFLPAATRSEVHFSPAAKACSSSFWSWGD
jgi:hypothetical protein